MEDKKTVLSGIQPSGQMTIANYAGAIRNFVRLLDEYDCYYFIADLHALTALNSPEALRKNTFELTATLIALGVDPKKCTLFVQSHVSAHCELSWILSCLTMFGEAKRMTQFKDKSSLNPQNINVGLFTYPVLQASDILLYQPDLVPVGDDQKQHIELSRNIAERFNNRFGKTFTVPDIFMPDKKLGARIMSLQEPTKKMSKSDENPNAYILVSDPPDVINAKLRRAVTDSGSGITFSKDKPGISNLLSIYSVFCETTVEKAVIENEGLGYGDFKKRVAECLIEKLRPMQAELKRLNDDRKYLKSVLEASKERASRKAGRTMSKVYKKVGLITDLG